MPTALASVLLLLPSIALACNSDTSCEFPYNNAFTARPSWDTHTAKTDFPGPCCAVMPGIPQVPRFPVQISVVSSVNRPQNT